MTGSTTVESTVEKIRAELVALSTGRGLDLPKLANSSLVKLPKAPPEWSAGQRAEALHKVIVECSQEVSREKLRTGAQVGFNVDGEIPADSSLTARIDALARRRGRHERTVREWFYRGTVEVALLLAQRVAEIDRRQGWPDYLTQHNSRDIVTEQQQFVLDRTAMLVRFSGRALAEVLVFRSLTALHDGVTGFVARSRYHSDPRPGTVTVEPLANCTVHRSAFTSDGHLLTELEFPEPLPPGHRISFAYRLLAGTDRDMTPVLSYTPKAHQENRYILQVQFDPVASPVRVWYFGGVLGAETRLHPENEYQWLEPSTLGYVQKGFVELSRGLHYGVAWDWP